MSGMPNSTSDDEMRRGLEDLQMQANKTTDEVSKIVYLYILQKDLTINSHYIINTCSSLIFVSTALASRSIIGVTFWQRHFVVVSVGVVVIVNNVYPLHLERCLPYAFSSIFQRLSDLF